MLGLEWDQVIHTAGLQIDARQEQTIHLSAEEYILVWNTMVELTEVQNVASLLALRLASGPAIPVLFSMSTAPNLETGLARLARYKHLFGPMRIGITQSSSFYTIRVLSDSTNVALPSSFSSSQIIFLQAKAVAMAARLFSPVRVRLPLPLKERESLTELFQGLPEDGPPEITYRSVSVRSPFVSPNEQLWAETEKDLQSQSIILAREAALSNRVKAVLFEAYATTDPSLAHVCSRLNISKSTLLRRLRVEGTTFQSLRETSRTELARRYLGTSDLSNQQIAHLLGYRDTRAFQRAFKKWTGNTPQRERVALRRQMLSDKSV